jgi:hydrogenase maturation protein HypF
LKRGEIEKLAPSIAPGNERYGIMLPYTPLHHLLLEDHFQALVMTSANFSEEPICIDNQETFDHLEQIADYYLMHDRDIYLRSDDSIVIQLANELRVIRRSRGYAPQPIFLDSTGPTVLGVGAELKNTVCLLKNDQAFLSQHIGDLENLEAHEFFKLTIMHFQEVFESKPELIIHDSHPQYLSTQWAKSQNQTALLGVQHHHAHMASVMAEHQLDQPVIGIIMDGTGYGTDETIWGGEILVGDFDSFRRFAYFEPLPLPGGDAAIRAPWRTAVSYLYSTFGKQIPDLPLLGQHQVKSIIEMLDKNINSPLTSSCGRLFDAVAALSGGRQNIKYEAQAAIEFMQKFQSLAVRPFSYILDNGHNHWKILVKPIIRSVVKAIQNDSSIETMSSRFHKTLIHIFQDVALEARIETGIDRVVLSGGVFQNQVLFENLIPVLINSGFHVYSHSLVPTNDGGIALGQVMIGRQFLMNN